MKCSFCEKEIAKGTGLISVKADGTVSNYCSSKCERNSKIRLSKKVQWTAQYKKRKAERMSKEAKPASSAKVSE